MPYRRMEEMRQERVDYEMWMMGMYITNAVGVAVSNAMNGKKSKAKYLKEPILKTEKREQKRTPEDDFLRFSAWVAVYNENFRLRNRQGK